MEAEFEKEKNNNKTLNNIRDKYCAKRNNAVDCVSNFLDAMDPCLLKKEKDSKKTVIIIATSVLNFICTENFDILDSILNDNNENCFNSSRDYVIECFNTDLKHHFDEEEGSLWSLTKFLSEQSFCSDKKSFEKCSINSLEKCENKTLKNLLQNFMKHLTGHAKCEQNSTSGTKGYLIPSCLVLVFINFALIF